MGIKCKIRITALFLNLKPLTTDFTDLHGFARNQIRVFLSVQIRVLRGELLLPEVFFKKITETGFILK